MWVGGPADVFNLERGRSNERRSRERETYQGSVALKPPTTWAPRWCPTWVAGIPAKMFGLKWAWCAWPPQLSPKGPKLFIVIAKRLLEHQTSSPVICLPFSVCDNWEKFAFVSLMYNTESRVFIYISTVLPWGCQSTRSRYSTSASSSRCVCEYHFTLERDWLNGSSLSKKNQRVYHQWIATSLIDDSKLQTKATFQVSSWSIVFNPARPHANHLEENDYRQ